MSTQAKWENGQRLEKVKAKAAKKAKLLGANHNNTGWQFVIDLDHLHGGLSQLHANGQARPLIHHSFDSSELKMELGSSSRCRAFLGDYLIVEYPVRCQCIRSTEGSSITTRGL